MLIVWYYNTTTRKIIWFFAFLLIVIFLFFIDVIIGKNTEELCNCIVGLSRETDIELLNKSDKWMLCSLNINQIQGDKEIIQLTSPNNVVLVKPNSEKFFKVKKNIYILI